MSSDNKNISDFADEVREPWRPSEERNLPYVALEHIEQGTLSLNSIGDLQEVASQGWRFQPSDVLFGKMRPYFRKVVYPRLKGVCSGEIAVVRAKNDDDINFLFYALANPKFIEFATVNSKGDRPRTKWEHFSKYPVKTFSSSQRKLIGDILRNYDDLIANNRRRITLLEEAARQLYQEWFVRLRFPGHENTKIVDGVPEGWEPCLLSVVANVNRASLNGSFDGEIDYIDISAVSPGRIESTVHYDFRDAPSRARRKVKNGDILWSCVRPNRRSHAVVWQPQENLIASTGFAVLSPSEVPTSFLYHATTTDMFVGRLEKLARGAAYPAVLASDFETAELLIPDKTVISSFDELVKPTMLLCDVLDKQNQKLRDARDLLLPRLMSGEITV